RWLLTRNRRRVAQCGGGSGYGDPAARLNAGGFARGRTLVRCQQVDDEPAIVVKNGTIGDGCAGVSTTSSNATRAAAIVNATSARSRRRVCARRADSMRLAMMVCSRVKLIR